MIARIALAVATLAIVTGCAHQDRPMTRPLSEDKCDTNVLLPQCRIAIVEDSQGRYECDLGKFRVDPDVLVLVGRKPGYIRWMLADPAKYQFCASEGDHVKLKSDRLADHGNVFESFASDTEDGARLGALAGAACKPIYNWNWSNAEPDKKYEYEIRFRNKSGRSCLIDPWILNGH